MSFLTRFFKRDLVNLGHPRDPALAAWFGSGSMSAAGISVTPDKAMQLTAVYGCVRILSFAKASLSLHLYKRLEPRGRERAANHYLYPILHDAPNRWQTAFEFEQMQTAHVLLRGNSYAEIKATRNNPVAELIPLHPDRVTPFATPDGGIAYEYAPLNGPARIILQEEMHHRRGMTFDGIKGVSPIDYARETLGLSMAADEFGARFFSNGANLGGVLKHPEALSDAAYERLKKSWLERKQGLANAHSPAILEEGLDYQAIGIAPEQAQFLETRRYQVSEIARLFGVPPHMLADTEKTTSWGTGIEQQGIGFVVYSLRPLLIGSQQAIARDLLTPESRKTYYAEYDVNSLLQGDSKARAEFYKTMFSLSSISPDEIRERENMNPLPDGTGDRYYIPLNMVDSSKIDELDAEKPAEEDQKPAENEGDKEENSLLLTTRAAVLRQAASRIVTAETRALRKILEKTGENWAEFEEKTAEFYGKHADFIKRNIGVIADIDEDLFAKRHIDSSLGDLVTALQHKPESVPEVLAKWEEDRVRSIQTAYEYGAYDHDR